MIIGPPKPTGIKVKARNIKSIRDIASRSRHLFDVTEPYADAIDILEFKLPQFDVVYDICDIHELGEDHGLTIPDEGVIKIREDVYEGACNENGRDRFTIFHEIGHLLLHSGISLARSSSNAHKWIEDSEWQANTYAAEFMMPVKDVAELCRSAEDIKKTFGVSLDAAELRYKKLKEQGLI